MILYFDCFSGVSGDMALGALLDCGVPVDALREGLSSLPVEGWHIETKPTLISGIHALDVTISEHGVTDADELAHAHHHHHEHEHPHEHDHDTIMTTIMTMSTIMTTITIMTMTIITVIMIIIMVVRWQRFVALSNKAH